MNAETKGGPTGGSALSPIPVVGLIGVGATGAGIVSNLRTGGSEVVFHDRDRQRGRETSARLSAAGARPASDLADLGRQAEIVVLCVPDSPAVESVLADGAGWIGAERT